MLLRDRDRDRDRNSKLEQDDRRDDGFFQSATNNRDQVSFANGVKNKVSLVAQATTTDRNSDRNRDRYRDRDRNTTIISEETSTNPFADVLQTASEVQKNAENLDNSTVVF